jgi:hypothetical protein
MIDISTQAAPPGSGDNKSGFATGDLGGVGSFRKGNHIPNRSSSSVRCEEVPLESFKHKIQKQKQLFEDGRSLWARPETKRKTTELARWDTRTNEYQARRHANAAEANPP